MTVDRSGTERCGNGGGNGTRPLAACRDGEGGDGSRGGRAGGGASVGVASLCRDSTLSDAASSTTCDLATVAIARLHDSTSLERL